MGRRSFTVASGVKVNVDKRSVGLTVGGKRARCTVNSKGQSTTTEVCKDALRSSKRNGDLLTIARYQRAKIYLRLGNRRQALRDLNRLCADQPDCEDVGALLERLTRSGGQSAPSAS
jgi:predicted Zn-dependent protease